MTSPGLLALDPAPFVTLQDAGRQGWQRFGVSRCGAMDIEALAMANALVGNPPETAALEFAHAGGSFRLTGTSCRVAITGGHFNCSIDGVPFPPLTSKTMTRGQILKIGGAADAVWGYIAVASGFDLSLQLGSRSTHARSGIGGFAGRALRQHDLLPLTADWVRAQPERMLPVQSRPTGPLHVVLGPQLEFFTPDAIALFLSAGYRTTHQMDRLGYRLAGPTLEHAKGFNIISDGLVPGCIQVPGSGAPIVLLRDAQPPGGYPKIATLVSSELGRFAQMRAGTELHFEAVEIDRAHSLRRDFVSRIAAMSDAVVECGPRLA